mmetsp:Transcript_88649/g.271399  ORF Transcript_88649/g.271399 Transcript_88649/m.271399 type:complete len:200 (-) Transcript_88649:259-858(-)
MASWCAPRIRPGSTRRRTTPKSTRAAVARRGTRSVCPNSSGATTSSWRLSSSRTQRARTRRACGPTSPTGEAARGSIAGPVARRPGRATRRGRRRWASPPSFSTRAVASLRCSARRAVPPAAGERRERCEAMRCRRWWRAPAEPARQLAVQSRRCSFLCRICVASPRRSSEPHGRWSPSSDGSDGFSPWGCQITIGAWQ